jgi:hypothetical protein
MLYDKCMPFGGKMNVIIQMIPLLFIQMITTMSSSSQMSTTQGGHQGRDQLLEAAPGPVAYAPGSSHS